MQDKFIIQGGVPLSGEVEISGYKNSAGACLAAVLLSEEPSVIDNLPLVSDVLDQIEILKQIKTHMPNTPVLMLSMHSPEQYAVRAIKAGASGYLTKESAPYELVTAVQQILSGRKYITNRVAEVLASSLETDTTKLPHENLSDREYEVLKKLVEGKSVSEISEMLSLNINTISTYRARILDKMGLKSNADLIRYAIEHKISEL